MHFFSLQVTDWLNFSSILTADFSFDYGMVIKTSLDTFFSAAQVVD